MFGERRTFSSAQLRSTTFDNNSGSPCPRLNAEAAGARSALNRTRQKRIRQCIPACRLKPLRGPPAFIYLDTYMLCVVY
jgi:hypothetical protein